MILVLAAAPCLTVPPAAAEDALSFKMTLENDVFTPAEIKVPANKPFVLKVLNGERTAAEIESGDLKFEKVAPAYTEIILRVRPMRPGRYLLYNEYREDVAKAYVVVE
jgi:hypothetical protein